MSVHARNLDWQEQEANWQGELVLPHDLRGPFVAEFAPQALYRHRSSQVASVLYYKNGGHSVITVRGAEHINKPLIGKPSSVCWIARGQYQATFQLELPTSGDRSYFKVGADVNWEVRDFYLAAEKHVVDVERILRPPLEARLRGITRCHDLDSAQQAEEAIQDELASGRWDSFGADFGLSTEVFVRIDLGQAATDYQAQIVAVERGMVIQSAIDTANRARIAENMADAQRLLAASVTDQYARMMASDPSRAHEVLGMFQQQAREEHQGALDYLSKLINQGIVQRHEIDEQVKALIDYSRTAADDALQNGPLPLLPPVPPPGGPSASDSVEEHDQ